MSSSLVNTESQSTSKPKKQGTVTPRWKFLRRSVSAIAIEGPATTICPAYTLGQDRSCTVAKITRGKMNRVPFAKGTLNTDPHYTLRRNR